MKTTTPTSILELPLVVGDKEERRLRTTFDFCRQLYNATLGTALGRLQVMRESKEWRAAREMSKGKERTHCFQKIQQQAGLTQYGVEKIALKHKNAGSLKVWIGAHECQMIAKQVWSAVERFMFGKGGRPRYKSKSRGLHSVSGKSAETGLIWVNDDSFMGIRWMKHRFAVKFKSTRYNREMLYVDGDPTKPRRVKYCRVVRRTVKKRVRWFLQIVLEGLPSVRHVYAPLCERVGVDVGPSKAAVVSPLSVALMPVAPNVETLEDVIRRIQRAMDRSRRAMNPGNYNEDGTVKKGALQWVFSKHYKELQVTLQELHRVQAATRWRDHGTFVNRIFEEGGTVCLEKLSYVAFQKMYGRSSQRHAMGEFVSRLKQRAASAARKVVELNTRELRMSQYDHITQTYVKKPLSQRWHRLGETNWIIQRDVYSALLAMCAAENGHDPSAVERRLRAKDALLQSAGLLRQFQPAKDQTWAQALARLTREPIVDFASEPVQTKTTCTLRDSSSIPEGQKPLQAGGKS